MTRPSSLSSLSGLGRRPHRIPLLFVLFVSIAPSLWAQTPEDAHVWLERMTQAAQALNYDGTFVYRSGQQMESMRIIHRADSSGERSRLVSLSGAKREVLRTRTQVICILPDDKSVVVAKTRPPSLFAATLISARKGFASYYALSVSGGDRVAGRSTEVIDLAPKDSYRYGYRLWVDRETGLLLKSDLLGEGGMPLEQFIYTSISLPTEIPDSLLEPGISGRALTWHISEEKKNLDEDAESQWEVTWLPDGFMMSDHADNPVPTSRMPVQQMVYTDGLASLSVFIEHLDSAGEPLEGLSVMGALNAYGRLLDGYQVTVVGEVPASTVQSVAGSVVRH